MAAILKRITSGTATINSGTGRDISVAISIADKAKTMLFYTASRAGGSGEARDVLVGGRITNSATLEFSIASSAVPTTTTTIVYHLVEFLSGVTVYHHSATAAAGASSGSTTTIDIINGVPSGYGFFFLSNGARGSTATTTVQDIWSLIQYTDFTTATLERGGTIGDVTFYFQLVLFEGATVQSGQFSFAGNATVVDTDLASPVDINRSFVVLIAKTVTGGFVFSDTTTGLYTMAGLLTDSDTISVYKGATAATSSPVMSVIYQVVELPQGNLVKHLTTSLLAGTFTGTTALSSFDTNKSVPFSTAVYNYMTRPASTLTTIWADTAVRLTISDPNITYTKGSSVVKTDMELSVITFNDAILVNEVVRVRETKIIQAFLGYSKSLTERVLLKERLSLFVDSIISLTDRVIIRDNINLYINRILRECIRIKDTVYDTLIVGKRTLVATINDVLGYIASMIEKH